MPTMRYYWERITVLWNRGANVSAIVQMLQKEGQKLLVLQFVTGSFTGSKIAAWQTTFTEDGPQRVIEKMLDDVHGGGGYVE